LKILEKHDVVQRGVAQWECGGSIGLVGDVVAHLGLGVSVGDAVTNWRCVANLLVVLLSWGCVGSLSWGCVGSLEWMELLVQNRHSFYLQIWTSFGTLEWTCFYTLGILKADSSKIKRNKKGGSNTKS
jgi:hypothetical protein